MHTRQKPSLLDGGTGGKARDLGAVCGSAGLSKGELSIHGGSEPTPFPKSAGAECLSPLKAFGNCTPHALGDAEIQPERRSPDGDTKHLLSSRKLICPARRSLCKNNPRDALATGHTCKTSRLENLAQIWLHFPPLNPDSLPLLKPKENDSGFAMPFAAGEECCKATARMDRCFRRSFSTGYRDFMMLLPPVPFLMERLWYDSSWG